MRSVCFLLACVLGTAGVEVTAQRRAGGRGGGTATLAITVTDPTGAAIPGVLVTVEGPTARSARTEGGRIAFERLTPGSYRLRFEHERFVALEREVTARGGAPIDVKVTLTPMREPEPPPVVPPPAKPAVDVQPAVFDVPEVIEKEYIGRGSGKMTPLVCGSDGSATLIQVKEPVAQHAHAASDEFLYVIAGEGSAQIAGREHRLRAGVLVFVPRAVPHALAAAGRNPLVLVSTQAGAGCAGDR